jgi:hypothetical protein
MIYCQDAIGEQESAVEEYGSLFDYESTIPLAEARTLGSKCTTSAMYVAYCRRSSLEADFFSSITDQAKRDSRIDDGLNICHTLTRDQEEWTCVYIGEVAVSKKGRTAAKRFRHEFGFAGYLRQAPLLESLCSLLYRKFNWRSVRRRSANGIHGRIHLDPPHKIAFLAWCDKNIRCAWREVNLPVGEAKRKLSLDEKALILYFKPLLNLKFSQNPFKPFLQFQRDDFRKAAEDRSPGGIYED